MSGLPFAFVYPPLLFALVALPLIWILLRVTPPEAQDRELPADAAAPGDFPEGGDAGADAVVADPAPLPDRGGPDPGARRPDLSSDHRGGSGHRHPSSRGRQRLGLGPPLGGHGRDRKPHRRARRTGGTADHAARHGRRTGPGTRSRPTPGKCAAGSRRWRHDPGRPTIAGLLPSLDATVRATAFGGTVWLSDGLAGDGSESFGDIPHPARRWPAGCVCR